MGDCPPLPAPAPASTPASSAAVAPIATIVTTAAPSSSPSPAPAPGPAPAPAPVPAPVTTAPAPARRIDVQALFAKEAALISSGSCFGEALKHRLRTAGPLVGSNFDLLAWIHELEQECSVGSDDLGQPTQAAPPRAPVAAPFSRRWSRGWADAQQRSRLRHTHAATAWATPVVAHESLDDYLADLADRFSLSDAPAVLAAFENGSLGAILGDVDLATRVDAHIRQQPPPGPPPLQHAPSETLAEVCAQLYVTLRSGFVVLPSGTIISDPTDTRNSRSVGENIDDVRAEYKRLRDLGHVITWAEAQRRHPDLRNRQPDHVLALGCVVKQRPTGAKKVRVTIDPSRGTSVATPHRPVMGLNEQIERSGLLFGCKLATVHHAAAAMRQDCWSFGADEADAYMQMKHSVDSLRFVAVRLDGELLVYNACAFGINSMCAQQQRLATVFARIVMRRWRDVGFNIGPRPAPDQSQAFADPSNPQVHLLAYLDDFFGTGFASNADAERAYAILCNTALELGMELKFAADKTSPPTCGPREFIGVVFCSRSMTMQLTPARLTKMLERISAVTAEGSITVGELRSLVGVLQFATVVFEIARLYLRFLLNLLRSAGPAPSKRQRLIFTADARSDLDMWRRIISVLNMNANLDLSKFSGISFRKGCLSVLGALNVPAHRLADHADHSSVESSRVYTVDTMIDRAANSDLIASRVLAG